MDPRGGGVTIGVIWAQSRNRVIGHQGTLPWHLPEDLAHFRQVTHGHPVIMGRRTWESLPPRFRPLPGRRNLVLSRRSDLAAPGAEVLGSLDEALARAREGAEQVWVIGGAEVYAAALAVATVAEITEVDTTVSGDTYAPPLTGWQLVTTGDWQTSRTGLRYRHLRYVSPARA